jgi:hypothetical protein
MITVLNWRPLRPVAALIAAAILVVVLAAALAHSPQTPTRYGVASNGVINTDGIQGSGAPLA